MRRALGMVPLTPIAVACVVLGCDALVRDMLVRSRRFWAGLMAEVERNR